MRFFRWVLYALATLWLLIIVLLWFVTNQLFNGYSRDINPDARYSKIMESPADYGVSIDKIPCANTYCLVMRSLPNGTPDKHYGAPIRKQLQQRNIKVPTFGKPVAWLMMLHGKGSRKEELITGAMRYVASGFIVVLPDLPAHGENTQALTWGINKADGDIVVNALNDAKKQFGNAEKKAFVWAMSMGGVYANRTIEQHPDTFTAMVIATSYDRLENVMKNKLSNLGEPSQHFLLWHAKIIAQWRGLDIEKSTPEEWAKHIKLPVLFLHGEKDTMIPHQLGKNLFANYRSSNKEFITVKGAGHQNLFITHQPVFAESIVWLMKQLCFQCQKFKIASQ